MTDKAHSQSNQELLDALASRLNSGAIHCEEILRLLSENSDADCSEYDQSQPPTTTLLSAFFSTRLLYVIGTVCITLGVLYLISQIWNDLNSFARVFITLGLGVVFAGTGSFFMVKDPARGPGTVFHGIGGLLVPGGALITLHELSVDTDTTWPVTLTIGMVFAFYVILTLVHKRVVLSFFALANGTALAYLLMNSLVPDASGETYDYLTMCIGGSYLLYAHLFRADWNRRLAPLLTFFGGVGFYGAAFSQLADSILMEMLFPILAFGGLALAVAIVRSRLLLVISTFAVIAYLIYFTAEYFADSIGWPVALILLGFTLIGIGYFSIRLNRQYLHS